MRLSLLGRLIVCLVFFTSSAYAHFSASRSLPNRAFLTGANGKLLYDLLARNDVPRQKASYFGKEIKRYFIDTVFCDTEITKFSPGDLGISLNNSHCSLQLAEFPAIQLSAQDAATLVSLLSHYPLFTAIPGTTISIVIPQLDCCKKPLRKSPSLPQRFIYQCKIK